MLSNLHIVVDLEIMYSYNLSFLEQILKQTSMSQSILGWIVRNLYDESRNLMNKARVRLLPEYWMFILNIVRTKDKLRLESVQKRFALQILGTDCTINFKSRCRKLGKDPIWKRRLKLNRIFTKQLIRRLTEPK